MSEALQVARGWVVIVLREIQAPRLPELDEVRAELSRLVRSSAKFGITAEDVARLARDLERH